MNTYKIRKRTNNRTIKYFGGQYNDFIVNDDNTIPTNTITTDINVDENSIDFDLDKIENSKIKAIKGSIKQITDI